MSDESPYERIAKRKARRFERVRELPDEAARWHLERMYERLLRLVREMTEREEQ